MKEKPFDAVLEDVARQNYERANLRLQYIISILHGDIPEEIVTYDEETESGESRQCSPGSRIKIPLLIYP